jgi:N-acetylglucosaminyl-diphospho-decaprenol L-rhamnosyltransferase
MHVAVAIVAFRSAADIVRCLGALERSTHADFEVVICENGGPDAFAELTSRIGDRLAGGQPVCKVLAPGNLGYAGGVNTCLRESAQAQAWWVLNPDTVPDPDAMAALVERLTRGDCEAVGGVIYFPDGTVESYGGRWNGWLGDPRSLGGGAQVNAAVEPGAIEPRLSYLSGASMMIGRRFLETVGPMREDYFLYCEEVEWFLRGLARGMRLGFAPGAKVLHFQGASTGSVRSLRRRPRMPVYLDTRNKILVTRDRFPSRLPAAALGVAARMSVRCLRRGAWRQFFYALAGWWAGLRDERGPPRWIDP